jgi:hypothetical protein
MREILEELPLSEELLQYYRERVIALTLENSLSTSRSEILQAGILGLWSATSYNVFVV